VPPRSSKLQSKYFIHRRHANLFGIEIEIGLEGFLSSSVEHLNFDLGAIGLPVQEKDLSGLDAVVGCELDIEHSESVVILGKLVEQLVPSLMPLTGPLHDLHVSYLTIFSFSTLKVT
jgi:hypothetical protein